MILGCYKKFLPPICAVHFSSLLFFRCCERCCWVWHTYSFVGEFMLCWKCALTPHYDFSMFIFISNSFVLSIIWHDKLLQILSTYSSAQLLDSPLIIAWDFFYSSSFSVLMLMLLLHTQTIYFSIESQGIYVYKIEQKQQHASNVEERDERRKKETFNCKRGTLLNEQTNKEELMLSIMTL